MIGRILVILGIVVSSVLALTGAFRFNSLEFPQDATFLANGLVNQTTNQTVNQTTENTFSILDPSTWLGTASKFFSDLINKFSSYITDYFKNIFPKATKTFGSLIVLFIILIFFYLLSIKFENIMRAIIIGLMIITIVLLIVSAIGFI